MGLLRQGSVLFVLFGILVFSVLVVNGAENETTREVNDRLLQGRDKVKDISAKPPSSPISVARVPRNNKNDLVLANDRVALYLDAKTHTLADLVDKQTGEHFVLEPGGPLFSISFLQPPAIWYRTFKAYNLDGTNAARRWYKLSRKGPTEVLELHYDGCTLAEDGGEVDVTVTVSLAENDSVFRWGLAVRNNTWVPLDEVRFPTLRGLSGSLEGAGAKDFIVIPVNSGQKVTNIRNRPFGEIGQGYLEFPSAGAAVQMVSYCDGLGKSSLYLAAEDAKGYRKTFCFDPMRSHQSFVWYVIHYPDGESKAGGGWSLPYTIASGPVTGDWYNAAKIYRKWVSSLPEWQPIYKRTNIPKWFTDLSIWYQGQDRNPPEEKMVKHIDRLIKIRQRMGEPIGFHWYLWEKISWHNPDMFPARPGFKEAIAAVEKAGVHVMPYIDIELYDSASPIWTKDKAEQWASRDAYHEFYKTGEWTADSRLLNMCPATKYWQDRMVYYVKTLVQDYGVKAVYLDELHVFPFLCYAKNHGHPTTGGTYFRDSYRKMVQRMKAECGIKDLVLTGEGCTEAYADLIEGQLNGLCDTRPDSIPLFQSVMKDNTIEWGLFISQAEVDTLQTFAGKIGHTFVRGRQLGWINLDQFDLLKPSLDRQVEFLRKLAVARRAGRDFLLYGEFLRTPDLAAVPTHKVAWMVTMTSKHEEMTLPDVMAETYRSPNGDIGIVMANITDKAVAVKIPVNTKDWGLKPGQSYRRCEYRNGTWTPAETKTLSETLEVDVPALSPLIVRFTSK